VVLHGVLHMTDFIGPYMTLSCSESSVYVIMSMFCFGHVNGENALIDDGGINTLRLDK
jgi:hypothetical protein